MTTIIRLATLVATLAAATGAHATPLWQDSVSDDGVGDGQANDVVANEHGVFAGGFVAAEQSELLVRAYDAASGRVLWEDRSAAPGTGFNEVGRLALLDDRLFATVFTARSGNTTGQDWVVRAYDARSGSLLWTDDLDRGEGDWARRVAAAGTRVFVAGSLTSAAQRPALAVRAYDAADGALLWEDEVGELEPLAPHPAIAASGDHVYVGGKVGGVPQLRAYEQASGEIAWSIDVAPAGQVEQIAVTGDRVVVAARILEALSLRVHDGTTGALLWQRDEASPGPIREIQLAATADAVFAGVRPDFEGPSRIHAYSAEEGDPLWMRHTDVARDLTADGGLLYAASGLGEFGARSFDAASGREVWQSDRQELASALALAVRGPLVFLAGAAGMGPGTFHVAAFDTRARQPLRSVQRGGLRLPTRR